MQLSLKQCRKLRDLLLTEDSPFLASYPSSPTPLFDAAEITITATDASISTSQTPSITNLSDLRAKSQVFPPASTNRKTHLFLNSVANKISHYHLPLFHLLISLPKQLKAIADLKSYKHLTIKEVDKGGKMVVMDNVLYKSMCKDIFR